MESIEKKIDAIFSGLSFFKHLIFYYSRVLRVRKFVEDEKFVKLINVVRLLVFFSLGPPYVARLFRGAQFGGRKLCSWVNTPLMQMEFLKYCIIRTGDSMRYYLSERFFLV